VSIDCKKGDDMKIDIYSHILPKKYKEALYKYSDKFSMERKVQKLRPSLTNNEDRFGLLDQHENMVQVLVVTYPPLEQAVSPRRAAELAQLCNDEVAELVDKFPKRYIAAVANLPMNNMKAALKEAQRAIDELGFKGVQIYSSIQGKPISSEEFMPLYELMAHFDLPIWIHPVRTIEVPDYPTETISYHGISNTFGWPFDTTVAMTRLIFAGIFERFPRIKFITHHAGGMVPYFATRIVVHQNNALLRLGLKHFKGLTKHPIEYFRMFYADTALNGNTSALMCAYDFFGEDRLLFGTDMPYDSQNGALAVNQTVEAVDHMDISRRSKKKIYEGNALRLLRIK
jgi:predicted TIM-barrel fold metal-dependent hydrolase